MTTYPVILCGGSGTRLWPLSRKAYPKQFIRLVGDRTPFQACVQRLSGEGFAAPIVVTGAAFRFIVTEQLAEIGVAPAAVLIEPEGKNTAPAVLAALTHLAAEPEARILVAPSDHVVRDDAAFRAAVAQSARPGRIVTFGIAPDRPETGYGYLELSRPDDGTPQPLARFVEKPDRATAEAMVAGGTHLWNAGIFAMAVGDGLAAYRAHAPEMVAGVAAAHAQAAPDLGFLRLDPAAWAALPDISIDYAVMEKAGNLDVVPFAGGWSDLGDWQAVWRELGGDGAEAGTVTRGAAHAVDCRNTLLESADDQLRVVGVGLDGIAAIATTDAVLVAPLDRAQEVRKAVDALKAEQIPQATETRRVHRPWGWYETLSLGPRFQVKRIMVHPGAEA